jgi:hypothetical protein
MLPLTEGGLVHPEQLGGPTTSVKSDAQLVVVHRITTPERWPLVQL